MRRAAPRHPESDRLVVCPFCGTDGDPESVPARCTGCGAARSNEGGEWIFDSGAAADRQAVAGAARAARGGSESGLEGAARRRPVRLRKKQRT